MQKSSSAPVGPAWRIVIAGGGVAGLPLALALKQALGDAVAVTVDGVPVRLTRREFELLRYLVENRNRVLSRDRLLERVWGYTFAGDTRTVDVHVRQLRRKLGDASPIVTVWGVGYKVAPTRDAA